MSNRRWSRPSSSGDGCADVVSAVILRAIDSIIGFLAASIGVQRHRPRLPTSLETNLDRRSAWLANTGALFLAVMGVIFRFGSFQEQSIARSLVCLGFVFCVGAALIWGREYWLVRGVAGSPPTFAPVPMRFAVALPRDHPWRPPLVNGLLCPSHFQAEKGGVPVNRKHITHLRSLLTPNDLARCETHPSRTKETSHVC